jgi:DNA end-binding protein Ku
MWSGTISFGLVSVPVNLMAATRTDRTSLRMVSSKGTPLKRRYFTTRDDKELEWEDIVRGYEVEKDRFVVVEDDELERLAPERSRDIDLRVFVDAADLDPIYFNRAYYLTPAGESTKAYRLLAQVMEETGRAGIATFVMRGKEYLVAITAENGILRAETLRFVDEVRSPEEIGLPKPSRAEPGDVKRIERKIEARNAPRLDTSEMKNLSEERLLKLAKKKRRAGVDVHEDKEKAEKRGGGEVIDLMEMLQRSLKGAGDAADEEGTSGEKAGKSRTAGRSRKPTPRSTRSRPRKTTKSA